VYSESCEAKRKRKLRQETKQKIDEKKLKNKLRVKRSEIASLLVLRKVRF
jgi:hypothetical protein